MSDMTPTIRAGLDKLRAGALDDAERAFNEVLAAQPTSAPGNHFLGVVHHYRGDNEAAIALFEKSLSTDGRQPDVLLNLGNAQQALGDVDNAKRSFEKAIGLDADYPDAHYNLGNLLASQEDYQGAITAFDRALGLRPSFPEASMHLGICLHETDRLDEAVEAFQSTLALQPTNADAHFNLGSTLEDLEQYDAAIASYRVAVRLDPDSPDPQVNLAAVLAHQDQGEEALNILASAVERWPNIPEIHINAANILRGRGAYDVAATTLENALKLDPESVDALQALGNIRREQGHTLAAADLLQRALQADPDDPATHFSFGLLYESTRELDKAEHAMRETIRLDPEDSQAWIHLGHITEQSGKFSEAAIAFRTATQCDPSNAEAFLQLTGLERLTSDDPALDALHAIATDADSETQDRAMAQSALGHILHQLGDHAKAFESYSAANASQRSLFKTDAAQLHALHGRLLGAVDAGRMRDVPHARPTLSAAPLFLVGMPRSGAAIIEQLLISHPDVACARAHSRLDSLVNWHFPDGAANGVTPIFDASQATLDTMAGEYLSGVTGGRPTPFVVDRMLGQFTQLAFIPTLFPDARIIHCVRDPIETCFSCFRHFAAAQPYSGLSLADLGAAYKSYQAVFTHWRSVLGERMIEVRYEDVVNNPESSIRALLEACGLSWNSACMNYAEAPERAPTLRPQELTGPIHTRGLHRSAPYAPLLGSLTDALA